MARIDLTSNILALFLGLLIAVFDDSWVPLAVQLCVRTFLNTFQLSLVSPIVLRGPSFGDETKKLLRLAVPLAISQITAFGARHISTAIVAAIATATTLGYYDRAYQLVFLPLSQLSVPATTVTLPILARVFHSNSNRYQDQLVKMQAALLTPVTFGLCLAVFNADDIVTVILGGQWLPAAPYLRILAVAGLFQSMTYVAYWAITVEGRGGLQLRHVAISRPLSIAAVVAGGLLGGPLGVVIGLACGFGITWLVSVNTLSRAEAPHRRLATASIALVSISLVAAAAGNLVKRLLDLGPVASLTLSTLVASILVLFVSLVSARVRESTSAPVTVGRLIVSSRSQVA